MKGMSNAKRQMMEQTAQRFVQSDWGEGVSELLAAKETALLSKVAALSDAADLDADLDGSNVAVETRAQQVREGVQAIISDDLAPWYIEEFRPWGVQKPGRMAQLAAADAAAIEDRMQGWVKAYRDTSDDAAHLSNGEIVEMHVGRAYGLDLHGFARLSHWRDGQRERAVRDVLVGNIEAAEDALDAMTAAASEEAGNDD